jgi:hypothetical protein
MTVINIKRGKSISQLGDIGLYPNKPESPYALLKSGIGNKDKIIPPNQFENKTMRTNRNLIRSADVEPSPFPITYNQKALSKRDVDFVSTNMPYTKIKKVLLHIPKKQKHYTKIDFQPPNLNTTGLSGRNPNALENLPVVDPIEQQGMRLQKVNENVNIGIKGDYYKILGKRADQKGFKYPKKMRSGTHNNVSLIMRGVDNYLHSKQMIRKQKI